MALLTEDKDLLSKIVETVSECIVEKILGSESILRNITTAIVQSADFKDSLKEGRQEIYESIAFDLTDPNSEISSLKQHCQDLQSTVDTLKMDLDDLEQYSRRNCLLIHGIQERDDDTGKEDTDEQALEFFKSKLDLNITKSDLDRSHRLGKKSTGKNRPIIVKFARYNKRGEVFRSKRMLKGSGFVITESLTPTRMNLLKEAKARDETVQVWSSDGRIICLLKNGKTVKIESLKDFENAHAAAPKPRRNARPKR